MMTASLVLQACRRSYIVWDPISQVDVDGQQSLDGSVLTLDLPIEAYVAF